MNITLFSQILQKIDRTIFKKLVASHDSNKHCKGNDSWTHFVTMLFCQFSGSSSLREVCNGMRSATGDLNHLGVGKAMNKSSLSYNNATRPWELFQDVYYSLFDALAVADKRKLLPKRKIYLLDSTTIDLCLNAFDWALFRQRKGAIKLHTVLDFDYCLPCFMDLSDGKKHDVTVANEIEFDSGSIVVADRGYIDLDWLDRLNSEGVNFVVRGKENLKLRLEQRPFDLDKPANKNIMEDWNCEFDSPQSRNKYPGKLRMVQVWDEEHQMYLELLTNNFIWTASTISELYKRRWMIEQFFKHIKTHLKIKSFIGTSLNAVLIQIWTAFITILLIKTLKKQAKYSWHLSNLIAFVRLNLFVKIELKKWLDKPFLDDDEIDKLDLQLSFF